MEVDREQFIRELFLFTLVILGITVVGVFLPFVQYFWPLPVVVFALRQEIRASMVVVLVCALLVIPFWGSHVFLAVILVTGFVGVMVSSAIREGFTGKRVLFVALVVSVIAKSLFFAAGEFVLEIDHLGGLEDVLGEMALVAGEAEMEEVLPWILKTMQILFPVFVFVSGALTAFATYYGLYYLAPRFNLDLPPSFPFSNWRLNRIWVLFLLASFLVYILTGGEIFLNTFLILLLFFLGGGLSIIYCWTKGNLPRRAWNILLIVLLVSLLFPFLGAFFLFLFLVFVAPFSVVLGIVDSFVNLRQI